MTLVGPEVDRSRADGHVSRTILRIQSVCPSPEVFLSESEIFVRAAPRKAIEIPATGIGPTDDNQAHPLTRPEFQGRRWPQQAFFKAGFNG